MFQIMDDEHIYCPIADDVISVCNCAGEDFDCVSCIISFTAE